jgi:hypothetical protein
MKMRYLATFSLIFLAGCLPSSMTVPVAVVGKGLPGGVMRGTNTFSMAEASFNVSGGKLSCGGSYSPSNSSITISIPVLCNDGRKGIVTATRDRDGMGGGGHFVLNDGTMGDFIFGEAAGKL